jgi:SpoIIAA-like
VAYRKSSQKVHSSPFSTDETDFVREACVPSIRPLHYIQSSPLLPPALPVTWGNVRKMVEWAGKGGHTNTPDEKRSSAGESGEPTVTTRSLQMIKTEVISANALRIIAPEKIKADDFRQIAPQVDSLISQHGTIRLLIDASGFNGWENITAFANHARFVKTHQQNVERIAVITAHGWQRWLIDAVKTFVHPEVRAYDKSYESEALQWIVG